MKFRISMICAVLLVFGLQLFGQQTDPASWAMLYQRLRRPGFPPGFMAGPYKPALGGTQTTQPLSSIASNDDSATYITFDVPGAGNATPTSINPSGAITGYYCDAINCYGILRSPDGTFSTFDDPSAVNGTFPASISAPGAITGYYYDANIVGHGFLRSPDGTFTTFDAPGAGTGIGQGTGFSGAGINPAGAIAGAYTDASDVQHGFLRASDGTFTTFDAPGAGTGTFEGTYVVGINPAGAITGQYYDVNFLAHGYLRDRHGALTTFDVPGAIDSYRGTNPSAINPAGAIKALSGAITVASCGHPTTPSLHSMRRPIHPAAFERSRLGSPQTRPSWDMTMTATTFSTDSFVPATAR